MGLGKEEKKEKWDDKWWENSYNNVLQNMKPKKQIEGLTGFFLLKYQKTAAF